MHGAIVKERIIACFILLPMLSLHAQLIWEDVSLPVSEDFISIRFLNGDDGYITISGVADTVYYTFNGGDTWIRQEFIPRPHPDCGTPQILSPAEAWTRRSNIFYKTTDAGASWDSVEFSAANSTIQHYHFLNMNEGVIGIREFVPGNPEKVEIYKTINGGQSFYPTTINVDNVISPSFFIWSIHLSEFERFGSDILWVSIYEKDQYWEYHARDMIISTDGGETWDYYMPSGDSHWPREHHMLTVDIRWYYNTFFGYLGETIDGGNTWYDYDDRLAPIICRQVLRTTLNDYWSLSHDGSTQFRIYHSSDKMESWQISYDPATYTPLSYIYFLNDSSGWAVGGNGTILKTILNGKLGDVNQDGLVNSTDALIILSCDIGMDVTAYCPMPCGDANLDGVVNSTDALIILSHDVGMDVPYPVGEPGCPENPAPCAGCE